MRSVSCPSQTELACVGYGVSEAKNSSNGAMPLIDVDMVDATPARSEGNHAKIWGKFILFKQYGNSGNVPELV